MRFIQIALAAVVLGGVAAPTLSLAQDRDDQGYWAGQSGEERHEWAERRDERREDQRENGWRGGYGYSQPYGYSYGYASAPGRGCWWEPRTYFDQWGIERSREVQICR